MDNNFIEEERDLQARMFHEQYIKSSAGSASDVERVVTRPRPPSTGKFVEKICPECGADLQIEGDDWICTGLVDPKNNNTELQACTFSLKYSGVL